MINSSLKQLAAMLAGKEISSVEMTQEFLARIDRHNPDINAYIALDRERTTAMAGLVDEKAALEAEVASLRQAATEQRDQLRRLLTEQLASIDEMHVEP